MATTTRKNLVIGKYKTLIKDFKQYTEQSILHFLGDDFDVIELIVILITYECQ